MAVHMNKVMSWFVISNVVNNNLLSKVVSAKVIHGTRNMSYTVRKLEFKEFGDPYKVLNLVESKCEEPQNNQVVVKFLLAPVNPADINTIQGVYPIKPELPGVPGAEAVGEIVAVGSQAKTLQVGDRVICNTQPASTWRTHAVVLESDLLKRAPGGHMQWSLSLICSSQRAPGGHMQWSLSLICSSQRAPGGHMQWSLSLICSSQRAPGGHMQWSLSLICSSQRAPGGHMQWSLSLICSSQRAPGGHMQWSLSLICSSQRAPGGHMQWSLSLICSSQRAPGGHMQWSLSLICSSQRAPGGHMQWSLSLICSSQRAPGGHMQWSLSLICSSQRAPGGHMQWSLSDLLKPASTWRTHAVVPESDLLKVPKDIGLVEAAGATSNPATAYRMLKDFVTLAPGEVVVQNGGNSAVGQNVIQLAAAWGLVSVNVVRDRPDLPALQSYLTQLGAHHVLTEGEFEKQRDFFEKNSLKKPQLALNCVGGKSALSILRALRNNGVMVTYGGMSREPVTAPTSVFIFKDISLHGFWMTRWHKSHRNTEVQKEMYKDLFDLMRQGKLKAPSHKIVPLDQYKDAISNTMNVKGYAGFKYFLDLS
ncbi:hypothetical protein J6590_053823 [Homalodisca vitripennis]|nr:hypothetical protein J6590_053823 [Homalodisca vitripennis]